MSLLRKRLSSSEVCVEADRSFYIVKANASANGDAKLRDDEIVPQMRWISSFI